MLCALTKGQTCTPLVGQILDLNFPFSDCTFRECSLWCYKLWNTPNWLPSPSHSVFGCQLWSIKKKLFVYSLLQDNSIMRIHSSLLPIALCLGLAVQIAFCTEPKQMQRKQTMPSFLSTIGALVPSVVSNVLPLVVMFSIGALLVPTLGTVMLYCYWMLFNNCFNRIVIFAAKWKTKVSFLKLPCNWYN